MRHFFIILGVGFLFQLSFISAANALDWSKMKDWTVLGELKCNSGRSNSVTSDIFKRKCEENKDDLESAMRRSETIKTRAPYKVCKESLNIALKCCMDPDWELCKYAEAEELGVGYKFSFSGGAVKNFDRQITYFLKSFNDLKRRASVCEKFYEFACEGNCKSVMGASTVGIRNRFCRTMSDKTDCLNQQARENKRDARRSLSCSNQIRSAAKPKPEIVCYKSELDIEQCEYSESGMNGYKVVEDHSLVDEDLNHSFGLIETVKDGKMSSCSGTAVGEGYDVLTASHCVEEGGRITFSVPDQDGVIQKINGTCVTNPNELIVPNHSYGDTTICSLDRQARVQENYFVATMDPNMKEGCIPQDHYLRCSMSVFESMDRQPASLISYPGSQAADGNLRPIQSRGHVSFDPAKREFMTPDIFADFGSSGGGYITELYGYPVVLTNQSLIANASGISTMPVITWREISGLKASLSDRKMQGAGDIFS